MLYAVFNGGVRKFLYHIQKKVLLALFAVKQNYLNFTT